MKLSEYELGLVFDALTEASDDLYYKETELPDDYTDEDRHGMAARREQYNALRDRIWKETRNEG